MDSPLIKIFLLAPCIKSVQTASVRQLLQIAKKEENHCERSALCVRSLKLKCSFRRVIALWKDDACKLLLVWRRKTVLLTIDHIEKTFFQGIPLKYFKLTESDTSMNSMWYKKKEVFQNLHPAWYDTRITFREFKDCVQCSPSINSHCASQCGLAVLNHSSV